MGFGNGAIRAMDVDSGKIALTFCRPHHLGVDVAADENSPRSDVIQNNK